MGAHVAHYFNTLSLFFPGSESFFVDSVRHYEDRIRSSKLRAEVNSFLAQESMHGREHHRYNVALQEAGLPARILEKRGHNFSNWLRKHLSTKDQLAVTVAFEHLTAILANAVLSDERILEGCDPDFAAVWWWHSIEETKHKAVAFDVYREVTTGDWFAYPRRVGTMIGNHSDLLLVRVYLLLPFRLARPTRRESPRLAGAVSFPLH